MIKIADAADLSWVLGNGEIRGWRWIGVEYLFACIDAIALA